jgi:HSP20 family protein
MANLSVRRNEPREPLGGTLMEPLRALDPLRMIRDLLGADPFGGMVQATGTMFAPDIEIKETKDAYMLTIDLPGVREQDIEVSITGNRLAVSGKREEEERREDDRFFVYERAYGTFSRSFVLPEGADVNSVKAELRNGVLAISVPKKAEVQARRVEIGGKESGQKELAAGREGQQEQQKEPQKDPQKKVA